ncbi:lipopolysaccharide biosynthesis protein [Cetobacterium somerae]
MRINNIFLKETILNYIYKIVLMAVGFVSIPLLLNYLGVEKYGIWVTIMAVISWAQMSDFGIGNGLRNKITENLARNNMERIKEYISTAYLGLSFISFIICILGILITLTFNLQNLFNTDISIYELRLSFIITIFSFSLNFVIGLGKTISYAIHRSSLVGLSQVIYSIILIILIYLLRVFFPNASLVNVSIVYLLATTLANLFVSMLVLKKSLYRPEISKYSRNLFKDIFGTGIKFFLIQLSGIVLFSTDSMIITKVLGPEEVTKYSIIDKLFTTMTSLYSIMLIALWSGVSQAYTKKDFIWIRNMLKKLKLTLIPLGVGIIILSLIINKLVIIWTGKNFNFEWELILIFSLYSLLVAWVGIFVNIINGVGKINLQMYIMIIIALLNIPLSIYFSRNLNMGIMGVKLATLICMIPLGIFIPIQVYKKILK